MALARPLSLVIRFLAEIGALAGLCLWGFDHNVFAGIAAPALAGAFWGRFIAPQSEHRLADPLRLAAELAVFAVAAAALVDVAGVPSGAGIAVAGAVSAVLVRVLGELPDEAGPSPAGTA